MVAPIVCPLAAVVARVAAAVDLGIAVKDFAVETILRYANAETAVQYGREIADRHHVAAVFCLTQKGNHAVVGIVALDPLKAIVGEVQLVQGWFAGAEGVEVGDQALDALVRRKLQQMPLQIVPDVPLAAVAELHPHKQSFLAGVGKHVAVKAAQVGKLIPVVAGHFTRHRAFAVYHLIVGERQHEVFAEGVPNAEGDEVVVKLAEPRVHVEIVQHVVHPAHVPLQVEAQAARVGRPRHHRPRGGFLGDRQHARKVVEQDAVQVTEKFHAFEVLAPPVLVGQPFPRFAAVVPVNHRGHRIYPNAIDVILLKPEQGAADQKVFDFVAAQVKGVGAPALVLAEARIGMFEQGRAVEFCQTVAVFGEVAGHPVQNYSYPVLVAAIDKVHEILRRTVPRRGGIEAHHLVAPGSVVRVFQYGQQFEVGKAQFFDVRNEAIGQFAVGEEARPRLEVGGIDHWVTVGGGIVGGFVHPRAEVNFVDGNVLLEGVGAATALHPVGILPLVRGQVGDDGGGFGANFLAEAEGVGFFVNVTDVVFDFVFVVLVDSNARHEDVPNSRFAAPHLVPASVPVVEVSNHRNVAGVGCPYGKVHAFDPIDLDRVRAHFVVDLVVGALPEQVAIEVGEG